jgi:hypothetical protein
VYAVLSALPASTATSASFDTSSAASCWTKWQRLEW